MWFLQFDPSLSSYRIENLFFLLLLVYSHSFPTTAKAHDVRINRLRIHKLVVT